MSKEYIERGALLENGFYHEIDNTVYWEEGDIMAIPTADVVEADDLKKFAEDVVYQFGYYINYKGRLHLSTGGLSTLEWAFAILGWADPKPCPECECEMTVCHEYASCGTKTPDGYKRVCSKHALVIEASKAAEKMDGGADNG